MDSIRGAQELALLLEERHGKVPETVPRATLKNTAAAPIYHWLGIEPPPAPVTEEGAMVLQVERRRSLTRYLPWWPWA